MIDSKSQKIVDGSQDKSQAKTSSMAFHRVFVNTNEYQSAEKEILICFKIGGVTSDDSLQVSEKQIDLSFGVF